MSNLDDRLQEAKELVKATEEVATTVLPADGKVTNQFLAKVYEDFLPTLERTLNYVAKTAPVVELVRRSNVDLSVLEEEKIQKIKEGLPEVDDANNIFMKGYTKFNDLFLGVQMLYPRTSPQRLAWQILAKLERKREALRENYFRLLKTIAEIEYLKAKFEQSEDELEQKKILIELAEKEASLESTIMYYKAAVGELGNFVYLYKKMKEKGLVPDNWDEIDFEEEDFKANLANAFYQAMVFFHQMGRLPNSQTEYFYKLGINPGRALEFIQIWYPRIYGDPVKGIRPPKDASIWDEYLEAAWTEFKECIKVPAKMLGIDIEKGEKWYDTDFVYVHPNKREETKEEEE